ncbi:MAG: Maf family protein [Planctomycetaceae bacterium]|nr:Maf family protein [Planctomycetaceae bacterium]MCB9949784.1 Maf family protein [Planctomycetaceae bacterium]
MSIPFVLASRSPRRLELLQLILGDTPIEVCPPSDPSEAGFEDATTLDEIVHTLKSNATHKGNQVLAEREGRKAVIISADTVIIGKNSESGELRVLGQPPETDWQPTVRQWFETYYFGRTHFAATAVTLMTPKGNCTFHVLTKVKMCAADSELLEWYLNTGESIGKAGGYAIQGAASMFVEAVQGSLSNVVGLPIRETRQALLSLDVLPR